MYSGNVVSARVLEVLVSLRSHSFSVIHSCKGVGGQSTRTYTRGWGSKYTHIH